MGILRGVVLAGGKSKRFGSDKALAVYEGEAFLSRAVRLLADLKLHPVVVLREGSFHTLPGSTILYDYLPDKGPLGGIYTVMRKFPGDDFVVLTCDMPALEEKNLLSLMEEFKKKALLTLYESSSGQTEPFPGIYPSTLLPLIFKNISAEKLAMQELIREIFEKNIIPFKGPAKTLVNVNHPLDLAGLPESLISH